MNNSNTSYRTAALLPVLFVFMVVCFNYVRETYYHQRDINTRVFAKHHCVLLCTFFVVTIIVLHSCNGSCRLSGGSIKTGLAPF